MDRARGPMNRQIFPKQKPDPETIKRLLSYVSKDYKTPFIFVLICIVFSAIAGIIGSMFLKVLIDSYISPLLLEANPVFSGLLKAISIMAGIYVIGIISTYFYNVTMVVIAQGVLKKIRDEMFAHMQALPIKYFDTHTHGDIMSYYTNDADTLRQMISQSIPQVLSSIITIVTVVIAMIATSIHLTILVLIFVTFMLYTTKKIAGKSGTYFVKQQESIGKLNGFIEEMINGQKVIKVFCHEDVSKKDFDVKNNEL